MGIVSVRPLQTGIALQGYLTCSQRLYQIAQISITDAEDTEFWCALHRQIIVLIGIIEGEIEEFAQLERTVKLIFRCDAQYNHTVAEGVAVFTVAMSKDGVRVSQRQFAAAEYVREVIVSILEEVALIARFVVNIR